MPVYDANAYEKAQAALQNLLRAEPIASGRAAVQPETLSPEERKSLSERFLGGKPGVMSGIMDTALNPLTLMGLVLTLRYPIATADRMVKFGGRIASYSKKHFPGMLLLQDFDTTFAGTPLPSLFEYVVRKNHLFQEEYLGRINKLFGRFEKSGGVVNRATRVKLGIALDGLDDPKSPTWDFVRRELGDKAHMLKGNPIPKLKLNAAEQDLVDNIRGLLTGMYTEVTRGGRYKKGLLNQLQSMGIHASSLGELEKYFPHVESMTKETVRDYYKRWERVAGITGREFRAYQKKAPLKQVTKALGPRQVQMLPNEDDLKAAGLWDEGLEFVYRKMHRNIFKGGHAKAPYFRYSLDIVPALENYTRGMARTAAWSVPPPSVKMSMGQRIANELKIVERHSATKANMLKETYIPLATGRLSWEQFVPSARFSEIKLQAAAALENASWLPKKIKDTLIGPLRDPHGMSWRRMGSHIQRYFYSTTLGGNLLSPLKNMLQTIVTTIPTIGVGHTLTGVKQVSSKWAKLHKLRARGMDFEEAFQRSFPEFHFKGLEVGEISEYQKMHSIIEHSEAHLSGGRKLREGLKNIEDKLLYFFTGSERFNRLVAFYGGRAKALKDLPGKKWYSSLDDKWLKLRKGSEDLDWAANEFADKVTRMTQFSGGPMGLPYGVVNMWQPLRQFTQFPLRLAGFAAGPGTRLGGEGARNWGTVGRMALASSIAYGAAKSFGDVDISGALAFGALPDFSRDGVLSPLPLVPPVVQLGAAGLSAAAKGEFDDLIASTPLLVPGGVALARASTVIAPPVASTIRRPYIDYEHRSPDGRYALYTADGQLRGYVTPTQMMARIAGVSTDDKKEAEINRMLLQQRDRIRDFRRRLAKSIFDGDQRGEEAIQNEWNHTYPEFGPLEIKKSDIKSLQFRRFIPRLERLMETLPVETRPQFAAIISASLGAAGPGLMGMDPMLFGHGTAKSRHMNMPQRYEGTQVHSPLGEIKLGSSSQAGYRVRDSLIERSLDGMTGYIP